MGEADVIALSSRRARGSMRPVNADLKYDIGRPELLQFVPRHVTRLLDIGCAGGKYAAELTAARPEIELWGVEPDKVNAVAARPHFHRLVEGTFPGVIDELPRAAFDVVTFNDVLEHLIDPWSAIRAVRPLLSEGGKVIASIPNVRHRSVSWALLRRGEWAYDEYGLLDRTHLRFFTRRTMAGLFESVGWTVSSVVGINRAWHWADVQERRKLRIARRFAGDRLDDFFFVQYVVTASPG